jgi:uncharacterized protein HemX
MNEDKNPPAAPNFEGETMKMPENTDIPETNEEKSSIINAPLLFTLAVLLVLILAGMFYWFNFVTNETESAPVVEIERPTPEENNEPESPTAEAQVETMQAVSTSDELSAIESDIEATNIDGAVNEIGAIDAEIEASLE